MLLGRFHLTWEHVLYIVKDLVYVGFELKQLSVSRAYSILGTFSAQSFILTLQGKNNS